VASARGNHALTLEHRPTREFRVVSKAPASTVYDYYNPGKSGFEVPVELKVEG